MTLLMPGCAARAAQDGARAARHDAAIFRCFFIHTSADSAMLMTPAFTAAPMITRISLRYVFHADCRCR